MIKDDEMVEKKLKVQSPKLEEKEQRHSGTQALRH